MSVNSKIEKILKVKKYLNKKLVTEGLTKREKTILNNINVMVNEDSMSFDSDRIGGARPSRELQSKIETGQLPLSKFGLTQAQVDFFTSEAFKDSIVKLEELLGRNSGVSRSLTIANRNLKTDARNAFGVFMGVVGELMRELYSLQTANKEELEQIATESVERVMGIDREFFNNKLELDGKFSSGFLSKLEGMVDKIESISDEEIAQKFADIDSEKKQKIEDLKKDIESAGIEPDEEKIKQAVESTFQISPETLSKAKQEFSDEVSRRMIINMFRRGMSLYYANAYDVCEDKIRELPDGDRIIELSNVIQPIMLHMYWLYGDIGGVGRSGGGQLGQIKVDPPKPSGSKESEDDEEEEETPKRPSPKPSAESKKASGPFIIHARAATLPLLVHELVKGVIMFFTSAGGKGSPEQRQLAKKASTSLETEAYDLVYSEKFYVEFYKVYNRVVSNIVEQRELTPFLLKLLSEDTKDNLFKLTKSLFTLGLEDPEFAEDYIRGLVEKSKSIKSRLEKNPSYMKKKEYGSSNKEDDDLGWDFDLDV